MKTLSVIRTYVALKRREREAREALERLSERFNKACDARSEGERHFRLFGVLFVLTHEPHFWLYSDEIKELEAKLVRKKLLWRYNHEPTVKGGPYWRVEL